MAKRQEYIGEFMVKADNSGISENTQRPATNVIPSGEFINDVPILKSTQSTDDIVLDINTEVLKRVTLEIKKELQPNPIDEIKTIDNSIAEIIKPIIKIIDIPSVIDDNKVISPIDRVPPDILARIVSQPSSNIFIKPTVVDIKILSETEKRRLASEEEKRRLLNDERNSDIQQAYTEEQIRRNLFDQEIELMNADFENYLKNKYPEFDKSNVEARSVIKNPPSPQEIQQREEERRASDEVRRLSKQKQKEQKIMLQQQKLLRLDREKERKVQESEFQINKLKMNEINTFLEEDIIIEQKEKIARNPEIIGLTEVQIKKKEIEQYERRLGRPIILHRDIVESEESDFDSNAYTNSNDDLVIIPPNINVAGDLDKLNKLIELREELKSESNDDTDYIINRQSLRII